MCAVKFDGLGVYLRNDFILLRADEISLEMSFHPHMSGISLTH